MADQAETSKRHLDELEEQLEQMETQEKSHRDALQETGLDADKTLEDLRNYLFAVEEQLRIIGGEEEATK